MQLVKVLNGFEVHAREADHYVNATELCKAASKQWHSYFKSKRTQAFLAALASETSIDVSQLIQVRKGNSGAWEQGTWIHPQVMANFAQWVSPKFAVQVSAWVVELLSTGKVEINSRRLGDEQFARQLSGMLGSVLEEQRKLAGLRDRLDAIENRLAESRELVPAIGTTGVPRYTIRQRLILKQWPNATKKQKRQIYKLAVAYIDARHGETPDIAGGPGGGGPCRFALHHLTCLDDAIDEVREAACAREWAKGPSLYDEAA